MGKTSHRSQLEAAINRRDGCPRLSALGCHVLAFCAGAGSKRSKARAADGIDTRVCRTLEEIVEADPRKMEAGQVGTFFFFLCFFCFIFFFFFVLFLF